MGCVVTPELPLPPGIDLLLPSIAIKPPLFPGLTLCCTVPGLIIPDVLIPIGPIIGLLGPGGDVLLLAIQSAVTGLNALLDQIPPIICPTD